MGSLLGNSLETSLWLLDDKEFKESDKGSNSEKGQNDQIWIKDVTGSFLYGLKAM